LENGDREDNSSEEDEAVYDLNLPDEDYDDEDDAEEGVESDDAIELPKSKVAVKVC
jgi:hypothetical protein